MRPCEPAARSLVVQEALDLLRPLDSDQFVMVRGQGQDGPQLAHAGH